MASSEHEVHVHVASSEQEAHVASSEHEVHVASSEHEAHVASSEHEVHVASNPDLSLAHAKIKSLECLSYTTTFEYIHVPLPPPVPARSPAVVCCVGIR